MRLIVLGSGTSHGIPVLGCACPVCRSSDPRDKRTRASLFIKGREGEALVIDTGPEFRLQAIRAGITRLDALLFTHAHADHIHGLDDVRPLSKDRPLPVYGNGATLDEVRERFSYVFRETQRGGGKPRLILSEVSRPFDIGGFRVIPVPVKHGMLDILGWRIDEAGDEDECGGVCRPEGLRTKGATLVKSAVYLTDTSAIPASSVALISTPDMLVIDGLRVRPHETHFSFEQAMDTASQLGAKQVFLTHICHDYSHKEITDYCQNYLKTRKIEDVSMEPAYDGLEVTLSW
ncbi:MAG: MBL fold metallo-hydrolase [Treponema sp.]|nr:MBL fold metallo-hydrolase [Treponema sp.]